MNNPTDILAIPNLQLKLNSFQYDEEIMTAVFFVKIKVGTPEETLFDAAIDLLGQEDFSEWEVSYSVEDEDLDEIEWIIEFITDDETKHPILTQYVKPLLP